MDASAWAALAGAANFLGNRIQNNYEDERQTRLKKLQEDADMKRQQFLIDYREAADQRSREADWNRTKDDVMSTFADPETGNTMGRTRSGNSVLLNQTSDAYRTALAQDRELDNAYRQAQIDAVKGRTQRAAQPKSSASSPTPKMPKPPVGYRWAADGESLEPIPGGPRDSIANPRPATTKSGKAGGGDPKPAAADQALSILSDMEEMLKSGKSWTGPVEGTLFKYGKGGQSFQSAVDQLVNPMQTLTRIPGSGAQSDLELKQMLNSFPNVDTREDVNLDRINRLRSYINKLQGTTTQQGATPQQQAPAQAGSQVGKIITAPDGKKYRIIGGDPNDPDVEPVE